MTELLKELEEQSAEKAKTVAGVSFDGTREGKLDEGDIDSDDFESHYLFPGDDKSSSSYPVVDAEDYLRRGNVESAYSVGARGDVSEDELHSKLQKLNDEFDSPPIDFEDDEDESSRYRSKAFDDLGDGEEAFERSVQFKAADAEKQIAIGAVLVPDRVDHQGDFFREETIRSLAENFEDRVQENDAVPGVMHAVFPDHIELADNRVTEGKIELGDRTLPKGTWMQAWKFNDDELWSLIDDGIIGGYSIGGTISDEWIQYDPKDHPDDVSFPAEVKASLNDAGLNPEEVSIREITDGRILEVSAVDYPAVPDATHEAYKSGDLAKADPALTGSIVESRLYLEERGHSEDEARRLANYLNREKSRKSDGWIQRAKDFFTSDQDQPEQPDTTKFDRRNQDPDQGGSDQDPAESSDSEKAGRPLSEANVRSAMMIHDAALDQLNRSDVDHSRTKFTSDDSVDFNAGSYGKMAESDQTTEAEAVSSTGSSADELFQSMSNDKADQIIENLEQLNKRLADDDDGADEDPEKSENDEDPENDPEKSGSGDENGSDGSDELEQKVDDLQKTVSNLAETVDKGITDENDGADELEAKLDQMEANQKQMADIVTQMAQAQGVSQQADLGKSAEETDETFSEKNSPFAPKSQQGAGSNGGAF